MQTVEAQYTFDREEFLLAHKFAGYVQLRRSLRFFYLLCALVFGVASCIIMNYNSYAAFSILFLAFLIVLSLWNQPIQVKKDFEVSPLKDAQFTWRFGEARISVTTSITESQFDWRRIIAAVQCKEGYLLFVERRMFNWLPRKAFASPEDFETFEKLVKEKVSIIKKV